MLEGLRKNMKAIIWGIIVVFLATIAIAWGLQFSGRGGPKNYVAKINGKKVTYEDFNSVYSQWAERYRKTYSDDFDDAMAENLKRMILNNLVFNELMYQEALKNGMKTTGYEIDEALKSLQIFQNESGQFDPNRYMQGKKVLPNSWWKTQTLEMKKTLLARKLELAIRNTVKTSDEDLLGYYREQNAQVRMDYIYLDRKAFPFQPSDQELQKFYEVNKEKYKKPEQVQVEYLAAPKPSEEDIPDSGIRNGIISNLKKTMENAYNEMDKDKKDMRETGNRYNLEYDKTPLFTRLQSLDNQDFQLFSQAAFMLSDPGELTDRLESEKFFYILRLVQRIEAHVPAIGEAGKEIKEEVVSVKQEEMAGNRAKEISAGLKTGGEKNYASGIKTTQLFRVTKEIPGIKGDAELKKSILNLKTGEWSGPLKTEEGYLLAKVVEKNVPQSIVVKDTETLSELRQEVQNAREYQVLQEWFKNVRKRAKIENTLFPEGGEAELPEE